MKEILAFWHLQEALEEIGKEIVKVYKEKLQQPDANGWNRVASSQLLNSVNFLVLRSDREIWVELHLEDYWKYLEYGTKPHWPPVDAIKEWIKIKPVLPRPDKNGKLPTEKQLAFLIGRKISREGTQPYMLYNQTLDDLNDWISRKLEEAITLDLEEDIDFILIRYFK